MLRNVCGCPAKQAIAQFDWIHSIDRLSLAEQCDRHIFELGKSPKLLLQVKLADDHNKSGWSESELLADLPNLEKLANLNIVGLMTILPLGLDESQAFDVFSRLGELALQLRSRNQLLVFCNYVKLLPKQPKR